MKRLFSYLLPLLFIVASCIGVEFSDTVEVRDDVRLRMDFDWSAVSTDGSSDPSTGHIPSAGIRDEEMCVVLSRIVNTVHYICRDTVAVVENGDYYLMAFNDQALYRFDGLSRFENELSFPMKEIMAVAPELTDDEVRDLFSDDHTEYNQSYTFISMPGPLYVDVFKKTVAVPPADSVMTFVLRPLTQHLTVSIQVGHKEDIRITDVRAILSGVPSGVHLMSGIVDNTRLHRVGFDMQPVSPIPESPVPVSAASVRPSAPASVSTVPVRPSATVLETYSGEIDVLGLFPSLDAKYVTGPGILELVMEVVDNQDDVRYYHVGVNLRGEIGAAQLMKELKDGSGYVSAVPEARLDVRSVLNIDRGQIFPDTGQGVEDWFVCDENIDVEI